MKQPTALKDRRRVGPERVLAWLHVRVPVQTKRALNRAARARKSSESALLREYVEKILRGA